MFKGYLIREKVRGKAILRCEYSTNKGNKRSSTDRYLFKCTQAPLFFLRGYIFKCISKNMYVVEIL